jgi:VWFA-related protein
VRRRGTPVLGALLALVLARAAAPVQTPPPISFGVDVDVVSLTAVVYDKAGRFVRGLGPRDVEIYEDGVRQELTYLKEAGGEGAEKIPLSVALVLDTSGSMEKNLHFLQEAAGHFVGKLEDVDEALLVQFNQTVKGSVEFSADLDRLDQFIEGLQAWGATSLYDAIQYGLERIKDRPGRKAIVVFSDGADTSSQIKEDDVVAYARSVEATVYCVGIRGSQGLQARSPRGFLRRVAKETGGAFFFPERVGDLIKVFAEIANELHSHYALAYTPKRAADGTWREIELRLARRDLKDVEVRVRKGYFAVKRRAAPRPAGQP